MDPKLKEICFEPTDLLIILFLFVIFIILFLKTNVQIIVFRLVLVVKRNRSIYFLNFISEHVNFHLYEMY